MATVIMTPGGGGANLSLKEYARKIEPALYQMMKFLPTLAERVEKVRDTLFVRRMGTVAAQTLGSTHAGTGFEYTDASPAVYQITPTWLITAVAYPDSAPRRQGDEIKSAYADTANRGLAAALDQLVLAEINAWTGVPIGPADIAAGSFRDSLTNLATEALRLVGEEGGAPYMILHTSQISHALAIPELTHADIRNDKTPALRTGKITTGYGLQVDFTTLTDSDGEGYHGAAYYRDAIHYGYNKRPSPEVQRYEKQTRLTADAEIGFETIFPELLQEIITP